MTTTYMPVVVTYLATPTQGWALPQPFTIELVVDTGSVLYSSVSLFKERILVEHGKLLTEECEEWCKLKRREFMRIVDIGDRPDRAESEEYRKRFLEQMQA